MPVNRASIHARKARLVAFPTRNQMINGANSFGVSRACCKVFVFGNDGGIAMQGVPPQSIVTGFEQINICHVHRFVTSVPQPLHQNRRQLRVDHDFHLASDNTA